MPEFKLKIAGRVGAVSGLFGSTPVFLEDYATSEEADFCISVSAEDLKHEQIMRDLEAREEGLKPRVSTEPFLERLVILRKFAEALMEYDTLLVHGSAVAVDGVGYLFTAPCGTGKSTHTRLWRQVFGDRAVMINDDKPFLRLTDSGVMICGSPWSGKHGLATNIEVPLGGICLLERGQDNIIRPLGVEEYSAVISELRWFMEPQLRVAFDSLARELLRRVPLWHMACNRDPEAAVMSHGAMSQTDKIRFFYPDKGQKDRWLPKLFDLLYDNMCEIAPTGLSYEEEKGQWLTQVSPALEKAPRRIFMAEVRDEPVGYVQFYVREDLLMIEEIQIRKDCQRTTLFLQLCRRLMEDLPEGIRYIEAYADPRNERSRRLMARLGMMEVPEEGAAFVHLRGEYAAVRGKIIG